MHKLFWIALRRLWTGWKEPLILVTPRTVVAWHRAGFRLYWRWLSGARHLGGRKRVGPEIWVLIFHMAAENPTWGAPRIPLRRDAANISTASSNSQACIASVCLIVLDRD